jgi:hypothetical protein
VLIPAPARTTTLRARSSWSRIPANSSTFGGLTTRTMVSCHGRIHGLKPRVSSKGRFDGGWHLVTCVGVPARFWIQPACSFKVNNAGYFLSFPALLPPRHTNHTSTEATMARQLGRLLQLQFARKMQEAVEERDRQRAEAEAARRVETERGDAGHISSSDGGSDGSGGDNEGDGEDIFDSDVTDEPISGARDHDATDESNLDEEAGDEPAPGARDHGATDESNRDEEAGDEPAPGAPDHSATDESNLDEDASYEPAPGDSASDSDTGITIETTSESGNDDQPVRSSRGGAADNARAGPPIDGGLDHVDQMDEAGGAAPVVQALEMDDLTAAVSLDEMSAPARTNLHRNESNCTVPVGGCYGTLTPQRWWSDTATRTSSRPL